MHWVPPSLPRNDLQSSRRLVKASALCSLISDRTPWRSSSSPILHKQEQRLREQTEPQGSPRIWGAPGQAAHRAEHRTAAPGHSYRACPHPTHPGQKENPVPGACRRGQDRQGLGRSDFLPHTDAPRHTPITVWGWSPRRTKTKNGAKVIFEKTMALDFPKLSDVLLLFC